VAALLCSRGSELSAQTTRFGAEVRPYLPTRISLQNGALHLRQKIGVTAAARVTLIFNQRFDVVTGVSYIPGYAVLRGAGKRIDVGTGSHQLAAGTRARYWLLPASRMLSWQVHAGLGVVAAGERAYRGVFESSTVSGVLATTVRYQIGRIVSLQVRVQERLFRIRFGGSGLERSKSPLRVSFGVGFPFLDLLQSSEPLTDGAVTPHPAR
jgi:hypothetical protein